jgi:hypothetical protein
MADVLAKVGGLFNAIFIVVRLIVLVIANGPCMIYMAYTPFAASKLYSWRTPDTFPQKEGYTELLDNIPYVANFDLKRHNCCCIPWVTDYAKAMAKVEEDMNEQLDIV